ncbi:MAG TPA: penicillin-binding transpeptidase domain-containing protein [Pyrinomonadaceae bacterium]|nr:penicillin-binding transpeptidase domain-containing protein [Pyrinomonadaceae bacterium]
MFLKFPFPGLAAFVISAIIFCAAPAAGAAPKKGSKKAPAKAPAKSAGAKSAKGKKGREEAASRKKAAPSKREKQARGGRNERASKNDRRSRREEERASAKERRGKDSKKMSKRERLAEARREAERRRREAAERARQLAIARAIAAARIRAFNQALRDETVSNIMKDETTGEDAEVRRVAVKALGEKAGTVVVMNPKTGRVYTVVNQDWGLRRGFKPCSTIKLVTGLAGLTEKVIDPVQTVNIGTSSFSLDLTDSLALSNNGYFQRVGGQVGFDKMMDYARQLGLGQPTGINHKFESPGKLPVFKEGFALNRMSSHGDDIEVTAVQLANMASAIANGGKLLVPHLPRTPEENLKFKREVKSEINIPQEHVRRVVPGMIGAVTYGTARRSAAPTMTVAGKTGSCIEQSSSRPWLGLFTSYAPVHDPQLAVAVILRGTNARGKWAAAVAGEIYRNLSHRFGPRPGAQPMLATDVLAPRPKVDARLAAEASDEEKDGEEGDGGQETQDAAADAYVVSEAGGAAQPTRGANGAPLLQKTVRTIQRPAPNAAPNAGAPAVNAPAPTQPAANAPFERPRRVSEKP